MGVLNSTSCYSMAFSSDALRYLGLLPEGEYNKETLDLYAGVVDQAKV